MNSSEIQWKEGIVISEKSNIFNFDNDMWDDNEILEVFDAAIRSHKSKGKKKDNLQSKKEIRSPKNVHFATAHEENIVLDNFEDEISTLPPSIRWEDNTETDQNLDITPRSPRVNFDLDSSVLVVPESTTHTDTEGSDCGNGGSDSSTSFSRKSNHNHNHNNSSSNSTSSSRRRQHSTQNSQILSKKKNNSEINTNHIKETTISSSSSSSTSSNISPMASTSTPTIPNIPILPVASISNPSIQSTSQQPTPPMTPNSNVDSYSSPYNIQPTQYPVPPTPYPHQTALPFSPLVGGQSNAIPHPPTPFSSNIYPNQQQQQQYQPQQQYQSSSRIQQQSFGVNPEMENLLTEMLMSWYQSGYTTGRYYSYLEQQQQSMQQWYAYYQSNNTNNTNTNNSYGSNVEGIPK